MNPEKFDMYSRAFVETSRATPRLTFDEFLGVNDITLPPPVYDFCKIGMEVMEHSKDPCHSSAHIERMFGYLDQFLQENDVILDMPVLLTSIIHHDNWRVSNFTPHILSTVYLVNLEYIFAGYHTAVQMLKHGLDNDFTKKVAYAIQKHGDYPKAERQTIESRLLYDLDCLDEFSPERVEEYIAFKNMLGTPQVLQDFYTKVMVDRWKNNSQEFYFSSNEKLAKRQLPGVRQAIEQYT